MRDERSWAVHVLALSAFAFAQPLFDLLSKNSTFFVAHAMDGSRIVLFALGIILVPPLVVLAIALIVRLVSNTWGVWIRAVAIGLLAALTIAPPITKLGGNSTVVYGALVLAVTAAVTYAYRRIPTLRRGLTFLAPAPLVFLAIFMLSSGVRSYLVAEQTAAQSVGRTSPPVVMVLLDQFSLGTIETPKGDIDDRRFPNFARLQRASTWYPNVSSNANATEAAMPAILKGVRPGPHADTVPPILATHPHSLFTLAQRTHELHVDEWISSMCPPTACRKSGGPSSAIKHVLADSALIELFLVLPRSVTSRFPEQLGRRWGGFFADPVTADARAAKLPGALQGVGRWLFRVLADDLGSATEVHRLQAFTDSIRPSPRPTLSFIHVGLPHDPFNLLPDTTQYDAQELPGISALGRWGPDARFTDEALQRYVMQTQATDRLIGRLIDALEEREMWDRSMVIVMPDHGVAIRPNVSLRAVTDAPGDLMAIPLFIKYPNQRRGTIDRRVAEAIDITPTIADVIGVKPDWHVDGASLLGPDPKRRSRTDLEWGRELRLPVKIPGVNDISDRIRELFGKGGGTYDVFAMGPHRELVGRGVDDVDVGAQMRRARVAVDDPSRYADLDVDARAQPARFTAAVRAPVRLDWVAVAVNGRIAGVARVRPEVGAPRMAAMLVPRWFTDGRNDVDVYAVDDEGALHLVPPVAQAG